MNRMGITAGAQYPGPRRGAYQRYFQMKVVATWLVILIGFTLTNIYMMASWHATSGAATIPANANLLSGRLPTSSNSSVTQTITQLREEIASLKQEFSQHAKNRRDSEHLRDVELRRFRDDMSEQIHELYKKIRGPPKVNDDGQYIYRVHLWDDMTRKSDSTVYGFKEKSIYSKEGFSSHPRTILVDNPEDADIVVWVTVRGKMKKEIPPRDFQNVVVLDYGGMLCIVIVHLLLHPWWDYFQT